MGGRPSIIFPSDFRINCFGLQTSINLFRFMCIQRIVPSSSVHNLYTSIFSFKQAMKKSNGKALKRRVLQYTNNTECKINEYMNSVAIIYESWTYILYFNFQVHILYCTTTSIISRRMGLIVCQERHILRFWIKCSETWQQCNRMQYASRYMIIAVVDYCTALT